MRRHPLASAGAVAALLAGCGTHTVVGHGTPAITSSSPTPQDTGSTEPPVSTETTVPPGAADLSLTEDLEVTDGDNSVRATVHINSVRTSKRPKSEFGEPPANGTFVIVNVTVTVSKGTLPVNPLYFAFQAPDGTIYHPGDGNSLLAGFDPELDALDVPAGQRVRGNVVFDGRYGHGAKLQYESPTGEIIGTWLLA